MPSPITNYAEQVLREEAERVAANKATLKGGKNSYANVHVDNDNDNDNVMGIAKVNLKDEDSFPALGKAKVKGKLFSSIFSLFNKFFNVLIFSFGSSLD